MEHEQKDTRKKLQDDRRAEALAKIQESVQDLVAEALAKIQESVQDLVAEAAERFSGETSIRDMERMTTAAEIEAAGTEMARLRVEMRALLPAEYLEMEKRRKILKDRKDELGERLVGLTLGIAEGGQMRVDEAQDDSAQH